MRLLVGLLFVCAAAGSAVADSDEATIFGDTRRETLRAMKIVQRSLGVRSCLHCHVKEKGKVDYHIETANKKIARRMHFAFVDTLASVGKAQATFEHVVDDTTSMSRTVAAVRTSSDAGQQIVLTVTDAAPGADKPVVITETVDAPAPGEGITCGTCHDGSLHFVTER